LRRFGVSWQFAALGAALLPLCPGVLHASSTVSNDAPAALSGAVALLLLARVVVQHRAGWALPTVAAGLFAATKVISALPFLGLAVALVALAIGCWRRGERAAARSLLLPALGIGLAVFCVYQGWTLFQAGRGAPDWVSPVAGVHDRPIHGLPFDELLSTSFTGLPLQAGYFLQPAIDGEAVMLWARALTAAIIAAPFLAMVAFARRSAGWLVGALTLGGLLAYPLVVELQAYLADRRYFEGVTTRYGMSYVPWVLGCLALVAWHRKALRLGVALTAVGAAAMLSTVTGLV
jgi:hypothetical protein